MGKAAIVLLVPEPSADRFGGMTTDRDSLLSFLQSIQPTEATGDSAKAMLRATALLEGTRPPPEVVRCMCSRISRRPSGRAPVLAADDMAEAPQIFVHRVPTAESTLPNICLLRASVSSRRILPNQPYALEVLLRNDGDKDFQVRVHRKDSENSVAEITNVEVGAGSQKLVKLPLQPKAPGRHWDPCLD